jgi:hypothetical protein
MEIGGEGWARQGPNVANNLMGTTGGGGMTLTDDQHAGMIHTTMRKLRSRSDARGDRARQL